jgi:glycosyltransferase involved in cell wall biosynthesis
MSDPEISIVIPIFNRDDVIRYTFESVRRATANLRIETIVVDDGSTVPVAGVLSRLGLSSTRLVRQENRGLLFARLTGLAVATGRYVLFLDSDDLVSPEKFVAQVSAMDREIADVSYTDTARCVLTGDYDSLSLSPDTPLRTTTDAAELFIDVQPAPHSPIFRRTYLNEVVRTAFFPPSPLYNPVAEIWFYHNAAILPGRALKVAGAHTIIGQHSGTRLTNHWERLGVASLAVMEAFARRCPDSPATATARQLVAEKAFCSWRRLPRDFSPEFCRRQLDIWCRLHRSTRPAWLGGPLFQGLTHVLGPTNAGRLLRLRNASYRGCRTLDDDAFTTLLLKLPTP